MSDQPNFVKRPDNYQSLLDVFHRRASENEELEEPMLKELDFDIVLDELLVMINPCEKYDLKPIADLMTDAINKLNRLT